jgi:hypothetical protein
MRNCDNMSAAIRLPHIATPEPCALSPVTRWPPCAFLARYHVIGAAGLQPNLRRSHWGFTSPIPLVTALDGAQRTSDLLIASGLK